MIKSRGTAHSNQVREFRLGDDGIHLVDVVVGPEGVVTGSARVREIARSEAAGRPPGTAPTWPGGTGEQGAGHGR